MLKNVAKYDPMFQILWRMTFPQKIQIFWEKGYTLK